MCAEKTGGKPTIITIPEGKICDYIDGKFRNDTPEEYVRQNIEKRLVLEHKYSPEQVEVEYSIKMGSSRKRVDLAVWPEDTPHTQENVSIIIECKKDTVEPSNRKEGVEQLKSYMSSCPNCEWGMWTNGKFKAVYRKVEVEGRISFEEPNDIPSRDGSIEDLDRPPRGRLKRATDDNLLLTFRTCHNHIYVTDGLQKQPAFFELLKIIFCKIMDERNIPHPLEFFASSRERSTTDGQLTVARRVGRIFDQVKRRYPAIFDSNDEIRLQPRSLAYVVSEIQKYSFLDTDIDVKGKAYEEIVGSNLRGDRGEFFTPRNIQHMMIRMLSIGIEDRFLDPCCGTGGFLVIAMNAVIKSLKEEMEKQLGHPESDWSDADRTLLTERIKEIAGSEYFGFDINPDLVKATKMNMVMNNDGSGNIFRQDSLKHPHEWSTDFRESLCDSLGIASNSIRGPKDLGHFDVIATNPPFGARLPIKDRSILEQYELGHKWAARNGHWEVTDDLQGSVPPEILFIERCWQFLRPGGRMAIVLPDAILGAPGLAYVRAWILRHNYVVASIDLHEDTFQPRNGTQTSVLILQKMTDYEMSLGRQHDYDIFMAILRHVGHDKRGSKIFLRDPEGNEILVPDDDKVIEVARTADGRPTRRQAPKRKIVRDETQAIAESFLGWKKAGYLGW